MVSLSSPGPPSKSFYSSLITPKRESLRREKLIVDHISAFQDIPSRRDDINRKPPTARRVRGERAAGDCNQKETAPCPQRGGNKLEEEEARGRSRKRTNWRWLSHLGKSPQLLSAFEILRSVDLNCLSYRVYLRWQGEALSLRRPQTRSKRRTPSPLPTSAGYGMEVLELFSH